MPKGATSRRARSSRAQANTATIDTDEKELTDVSTAIDTPVEDEDTVRELPFTVEISPAEEAPDRSPAGRKRIPSPYESELVGLRGSGWQNQPHDGQVKVQENGKVLLPDGVKESNARVILRELAKAVKFLNSEEGGENNLGLDVNVTASHVQFNIRDKQKRQARTPDGGESTDGEVNADSDSDNGDE